MHLCEQEHGHLVGACEDEEDEEDGGRQVLSRRARIKRRVMRSLLAEKQGLKKKALSAAAMAAAYEYG